MEYYGFTKEQLDKIIRLLGTVSVTGINQMDAFHEATTILRHPMKLKAEEGEKKND